jgi:Spy/CpxP family protein refolding chaperone
MKRSIPNILATAVTLLSLNPALAAPEPEGRSDRLSGMIKHHMHEHLGGKHLSYGDAVLQKSAELKLSDEQIGKITRIQQESKEQIEDLGRSAHQSMKATHELFLNPASDEAEIRKSAQTHTSNFNSLVDVALKSRSAINGVLTPEQFQKLKSLKSN